MKTVLTPAQVTAFLTEHVGPAINEVQPLSGGSWSQAFSYVYSGGEYVVRFGSTNEDFLKDEIAASLAGPQLPIPKMVEVGEAFDGWFAISERVHGEMLEELDSTKMRSVVPSMLSVLDAMRDADTAAILQGYGRWNGKGIARYDSWGSYLADIANDHTESRIHGWQVNLASSPVSMEGFNQALGQLNKLLSFCPNQDHLIHSDLLYRNVLVADDRIKGVIDWGSAMRGDFLYDIAWLSFWSPWYHAMKDIDWATEAKKHYAGIGLKVENFDERILCYKLHIGLDGQAYNAYLKRWDQVKEISDKTLALIW